MPLHMPLRNQFLSHLCQKSGYVPGMVANTQSLSACTICDVVLKLRLAINQWYFCSAFHYNSNVLITDKKSYKLK